MNKVLLIYFYLFLSQLLIAQNPNWISIELQDSPEIKYMTTDSLGFIWALSNEGLFKYNGYEIKRMLEAEDGEKFLTLNSNNDQILFLGTQKGKIIRYNPYTENSNLEKQVSFPVTGVGFDSRSEAIVAISYGTGVHIMTNQLDTILSEENILLSNEVYEADFYNNEIVLATDLGIQTLNISGKTIESRITKEEHGLSDLLVTNLAIDANGNIWISNFDSALDCIYPNGQIENFKSPVSSKINDIQIREDEVFVFTEQGLFSLKDKLWTKKFPISGNASIRSGTLDMEGNIWISNNKNQLLKGNLHFQKHSYNLNQVQALQKVGTQLWIGNEEGLYALKGKEKTLLINKNITCMKNAYGMVWVGTYSNGFYILDQKGNIIKHLDNWLGYSNQSVLFIHVDKDTASISSLTGVLELAYRRLANGEVQLGEVSAKNTKIEDVYTYQILEKNGTYYYATDREGIKIWENGTLEEIFYLHDSTKIGSVYSMAFDDKGTLWLASSKAGLAYLKEDKVYAFEKANILPDYYTSLVLTSDKQLLMVRSASVDVLDPVTGHLIYYDKELGLTDEPPFLNTFDKDGTTVWFSHNNEIFEYEVPIEKKLFPSILIDKVMINLINVKGTDVFKQEENNVQFEFTGSWLSDPENLVYEYQLQGIDEQWRETKDRKVSYPKLRPGNYEFVVRASEDQNFENSPVASYKFKIKKAFYNTLLFRAFAFLMLGFLFYKLRKARIAQEEVKRSLEQSQIEAQLMNLQTQLNPHFLFNTLNILIGLIEENPQKSIKFTEKISDFYRSILEEGKKDLIPLSRELDILESYLTILKERFNVDIEIETMDADQYAIPPLTLQLLVENAAKHNVVSMKTALKISIIQRFEKLTVSNVINEKVTDAKGTKVGLKNIKRRFQLINLLAPEIEKTDTHFVVKLYLKKI